MRTVPSALRRSVFHWAVGALAGLALAPVAFAQAPAYPSKPITIVVGYPPGGSTDLMGRMVGTELSNRLGQPVVIENIGGAGGAIGAQKVASAQPDGYTLLVGASNELAINKLVTKKVKYDIKDFTAIGLVASQPLVLVASPASGVKNAADFIQLVSKNPGKYSYGSSGVGSTLHFAGELVKQRAGVFMTHIPYRGTAPLTSDLVGGVLDFAMLSPTAAAPFLQTQRITALGVTSARRMPQLPQVPALGEAPALKGYDLSGWFALVGPRGLPAEVQQRLAATLREALQDAGVKRRLEDGGTFPATGGEDLAALIRDDSAQYARLVKFANVGS